MVNIRLKTETLVFLTPKPECIYIFFTTWSYLPDEGRGAIGFEMGLEKQI